MARKGSRLPHRAPELLSRSCPSGVRQGGRTSAEGQEPLLLTLDKSEERRSKAATGRLFFGYFLLAAQKKVARLRGRDPDSSKRRGSDSLNNNVTHQDGKLELPILNSQAGGTSENDGT
jgi:hypothetical protein